MCKELYGCAKIREIGEVFVFFLESFGLLCFFMVAMAVLEFLGQRVWSDFSVSDLQNGGTILMLIHATQRLSGSFRHGGFHKWGSPQSSSIYRWIFHQKKQLFGGNPIYGNLMKPPNVFMFSILPGMMMLTFFEGQRGIQRPAQRVPWTLGPMWLLLGGDEHDMNMTWSHICPHDWMKKGVLWLKPMNYWQCVYWCLVW